MLRKQKKSSFDPGLVKTAKVAVIRAQFNSQFTKNLEKYCIDTLLKAGIGRGQIANYVVPGSLEIPLVAQMIAAGKKAQVIIALGMIIKGDTFHFELVCQECARGCMDVSLKFNIPVIFGVVAAYDLAQAKKRAGRNDFNRGIEAANAAIEMLTVVSKLKL